MCVLYHFFPFFARFSSLLEGVYWKNMLICPLFSHIFVR